VHPSQGDLPWDAEPAGFAAFADGDWALRPDLGLLEKSPEVKGNMEKPRHGLRKTRLTTRGTLASL